MADGTSFAIDLGVAGASSYDSAATSLAALADRLTLAGTAASEAADALAAGETSYRQAEAAANSAAKALEKVGLAADAQHGKIEAALKVGDIEGAERAAVKLNALTIRQLEAAAKADATSKALVAEAAALDKLKVAAGAATDAEAKLSKAHDAAKKTATAMSKATEATKGSGNVKDAAEGFAKLGGALGPLGKTAADAFDGIEKLGKSLGATGGIYVAAAIAAAALTVAIVAGTLAIAKWAIGLSDANRSARLLSDGIAGTVAGGRELDAAIADLEKRVPQTSDELRSMAADLAKTGLKGQALTDALESAATKAAELKWGPDFAKGAVSLDKLSTRLTKNISGIFGGLNIEGFLAGLSKIVDLFDATSVTGKAIKVVFESIFQPLVDGMTALAPKIVATFIQFEIWALKAMIAIKPFGSTIVTIAKVVGVAVLAIVAVFAVAAGVIVGMAAAAGALVVGLAWLGATITGLIVQAVTWAAGIISGPGAAFDWLKNKVTEAINFLRSLSLADIGTAMIDGLVAGITGAAGKILSAMTGAVGGAIDGAKKLLGIASPSKVFAEIGMNTGEGMASGVESATGGVQSAIETMTMPTETQGTAPTPAGAGGGLNLAGATFVFNGVEGAEDAEARFGGLLTRLLEGDATQLGAGAEVPA